MLRVHIFSVGGVTGVSTIEPISWFSGNNLVTVTVLRLGRVCNFGELALSIKITVANGNILFYFRFVGHVIDIITIVMRFPIFYLIWL